MSDPTQDDEQKRFRVVEVRPEELGAQGGGRGAWMAADTWPGSSAPERGDRKSEGSRRRLPSIVVTTTTVVRFVDADDDHHEDGGKGAWMAADTRPGSNAPAGNVTRGESAWVANDRWPGSDAPAGNVKRGESAWVANDRWPGSSAPSDNRAADSRGAAGQPPDASEEKS